ncbi:protein FAR1-RELATED SEQUENCE 5-like [Camellia sinensis]|uniref:protein FAR1-RELATED SEQUENCE 5-like n=1 Tax=Camellia sinensis TaxID=4442 RepID=UPI0010355443|nr:protein FAR1-RELATED SEQUENCE 5-like [Camellia sinensis]
MYLACERSGQYRATKKLKHDGNNTSRITGMKKCGCPFDMRAHRFTTHDEWTLTVVCGLHNHPPAEHLEGHSYVGRLSKDEKALLMDMSKSMVRPKEILVTLKQRDALNVSTLKTIYNVRHRKKVVQRAGRSQMQHLFGELAKYDYIECHRSEESTMTVTDLFWAHPTSLDLFRYFPPFAYLQYERVDNYVWVLATLRDVMDGFVMPTIIVTDRELALMNAIQKIFPSGRHLLCRWHISKNVLTKCKKMFETQQKWEKFKHEWNSLVYSSSEIQYDERLKSLLKEFSSYPDAVKYVMDTWAESAHIKLKRQLGSCQVSFQASFEKIHSLLELQHTDIKASFEKSLTIVQHQFKPSQFSEQRGNVSISALEYLLVESKRANSIGIDIEAYGCILRHTHGLPCAHKIADYIRQDRPIPLATIHSQWRQLHNFICKKEEETEVSCHAEVELFVNKFNESDRTMQLELLKKLKKIVYPGNTFLVEPVVKPKTRPRDHKKINVSTRCDPCSFELSTDPHGHARIFEE